MANDLHAAVAARLRRHGQRYTASRRAIVDVLTGSRRPLTIPEILGSGRGLAQSSVYRNLAALEQVGVSRRIAGADEFVRYELDDALTDHHHHHLICTDCGTVIDFTVPVPLEQALEHAIERVSADTGFRTDHHRLDLLGTCPACR